MDHDIYAPGIECKPLPATDRPGPRGYWVQWVGP